MSSNAESRDKIPQDVAETMSDAMPDKPRFERIGTADNGDGLYALNSLDILIYMGGLKLMQESDA